MGRVGQLREWARVRFGGVIERVGLPVYGEIDRLGQDEGIESLGLGGVIEKVG